MSQMLIETRNLKTHFPILKGILRRPAGAVKAVDDVSLAISSGDWLGLAARQLLAKLYFALYGLLPVISTSILLTMYALK